MSKYMNRSTHPFKAFLYGMGFGALLMFILLFPGQLKAFDENNEVYCMAQNIYFEAGNQPLAGKIAVGTYDKTSLILSLNISFLSMAIIENLVKKVIKPQ